MCNWRVYVFLFVSMMECYASAFVPSLMRDLKSNSSFRERHVVLYDNASSEDCIVIVGGGFGGLNAALSLSSILQEKKKTRIVLLDEKERFVFLPLLYELCVDDASIEEVAPTYSSLLSSSSMIEFVQAKVTGIDVEQNCIHYNNKNVLNYTALIVATGAEMQLNAIPGASQYALPFYTIEQCLELKRRFTLLDNYKKPTVVIVGGGYSGVELALNTMERFNHQVQVTLIHRGTQLLENATPYNQKQGIDKLTKNGIQILTQTTVTQVTSTTTTQEEDTNPHACTVQFQNINIPNSFEQMNVDLLLWTAGASSMNRKGELGILNSKLPRDEKGRIITGKYMRVKGLTNVFAIGDCSRASKVPYAATAQVAMQQAPFAAWNLYTTLYPQQSNNKMMPFSYLNLGEMMTLGSDDATISSLQGLVQLNGPTASILRRLIYSVRMPTTQQSIQALLSSSEKRIVTTKRNQKNGNKPIQWK